MGRQGRQNLRIFYNEWVTRPHIKICAISWRNRSGCEDDFQRGFAQFFGGTGQETGIQIYAILGVNSQLATGSLAIGTA